VVALEMELEKMIKNKYVGEEEGKGNLGNENRGKGDWEIWKWVYGFLGKRNWNLSHQRRTL
jgi:hypothetical protein